MATSVDELRQLKALFDAGHVPKDEFEKRKAAIIDKMTGTVRGGARVSAVVRRVGVDDRAGRVQSSDKSAVTSPQIASENKRKNDLYVWFASPTPRWRFSSLRVDPPLCG
jgi:hypothetical protein